MKQTSAAATLAHLWTKYCGGDSPSIWEIGSRDGNDAMTLTQFFPRSKVWAFEPNPMTFGAVVQNSLNEPRIQPVNLALGDVNGAIDFFQIDPTQTKTTWEDGNPGASSLFRASGEYLIETYVQRQISVEAARGDTVIRQGIAEPPNLIWMDVQGAEALVLDGLGVALDQVSMIYVELSLREIYSGQALAPEVIDRLQRHGFRWYSVLRTGTWQFDAVFLRTTFRPSLIVRNWFFTLSLLSGIGLGVSRTAAGALQGVTRRVRGMLR